MKTETFKEEIMSAHKRALNLKERIADWSEHGNALNKRRIYLLSEYLFSIYDKYVTDLGKFLLDFKRDTIGFGDYHCKTGQIILDPFSGLMTCRFVYSPFDKLRLPIEIGTVDGFAQSAQAQNEFNILELEDITNECSIGCYKNQLKHKRNTRIGSYVDNMCALSDLFGSDNTKVIFVIYIFENENVERTVDEIIELLDFERFISYKRPQNGYSTERYRAEHMLNQTRTVLELVKNVTKEIKDVRSSEQAKLDRNIDDDFSKFNVFFSEINYRVQIMYDSLYQFINQHDSNDEFVSKRSLYSHLEDVNNKFRPRN